MSIFSKWACVGLAVWMVSGGCEIINPDEDIPAYLRIDSMTLKINTPNVEGSGSHNLSDAWVFVDDNLIGAFELPVDVPVLKNGEGNLKVFAGIRENGISATRSQYLYMGAWEVPDYNFVPGETQTINPEVEYFNTTIFSWKEDFEDIAVAFDSLDSADVIIQRTDDPTLVMPTPPADLAVGVVNKVSGLVTLSADKPIWEASSSQSLTLPQGGIPVYFEMDYSTTTRMLVGMRVSTSTNGNFTSPIIDLNPTLDENGDRVWNKIYINLTPTVSSTLNPTGFQMYFVALHDDSQLESILLLDNLKIVHP